MRNVYMVTMLWIGVALLSYYVFRLEEKINNLESTDQYVVTIMEGLSSGYDKRLSSVENYIGSSSKAETIKSDVLTVLIHDYQQRSGNNMVVFTSGNMERIGVKK
jgi:hypothetical protein